MILHAVGGPCNRLRAILSYRAMQGGLLDVVWDTDTTVSGEPWPFLPLSGLRFVEGRWDVEDYAPAKGAPDCRERAYVELRLPDDVTRRIALIHGDYAAVHIRRTDHIPNVEAQGGAVAPLVDYLTFAVAAVDLPHLLPPTTERLSPRSRRPADSPRFARSTPATQPSPGPRRRGFDASSPHSCSPTPWWTSTCAPGPRTSRARRCPASPTRLKCFGCCGRELPRHAPHVDLRRNAAPRDHDHRRRPTPTLRRQARRHPGVGELHEREVPHMRGENHLPSYGDGTMSLTVKDAVTALEKTIGAGKGNQGELDLRLTCLAPGRAYEARWGRKRIVGTDAESAVLGLIVACGGAVPE